MESLICQSVVSALPDRIDYRRKIDEEDAGVGISNSAKKVSHVHSLNE